MSSVRQIIIGLIAVVGLLVAGAAAVPVANAQEPKFRTFYSPISRERDTRMPPGVESDAHGVAIIQVNAATVRSDTGWWHPAYRPRSPAALARTSMDQPLQQERLASSYRSSSPAATPVLSPQEQPPTWQSHVGSSPTRRTTTPTSTRRRACLGRFGVNSGNCPIWRGRPCHAAHGQRFAAHLICSASGGGRSSCRPGVCHR